MATLIIGKSRRNGKTSVYLGNISFQNEMLQKTAGMYEQDKKELQYEVWKPTDYCLVSNREGLGTSL